MGLPKKFKIKAYCYLTDVKIDVANVAEGITNVYGRTIISHEKYADEKLKYFCSNCNCVVCSECLLDNHKNHEYITNEIASKKCLNSVESILKNQFDNFEISDKNIKL